MDAGAPPTSSLHVLDPPHQHKASNACSIGKHSMHHVSWTDHSSTGAASIMTWPDGRRRQHAHPTGHSLLGTGANDAQQGCFPRPTGPHESFHCIQSRNALFKF